MPFPQNIHNKTLFKAWWNGKAAGQIDFTNSEAVTWWQNRLENLRNNFGIDGFKFDAGEAGYLPDSYTLQYDKKFWPNIYTTK